MAVKSNKRRNGKRRKSLIRKFITIVCAIVGSFCLIASAAAFAFFQNEPETVDVRTTTDWTKAKPTLSTAPPDEDSEAEEEPDEGGLFLPPEKTKILVMGTDETELLTDVILVGCFDRESGQVDLISIPRDTYVKMPADRIQSLQELGMYPPSSGIMKMNAVHSYAGKKYGAQYAEAQLMDMLGIEFDYYVEVNLKAFRQIVDTVGGVEMEIPGNGLHYRDPYQDLVIDVPGGLVQLDGKMAEGVVRYRATYPGGDLQRIEVQQEFLKQFYKQVLNRDTIINNAFGIASTLLEYVKTDFPLTDFPKYIRYIDSLKGNNLHAHTLPGNAQTINGASYFIHDEEATKQLVLDIFYTKGAKPTETPEPTQKPLSEQRIKILNGGFQSGLAKEYSNKLKKNGLTVIEIGDYTGTKRNETRIMTRAKGEVEELGRYFTSPKFETDPQLPSDCDVIVILGKDER